jgi:GNAT superfamily N-acetyltransferase
MTTEPITLTTLTAPEAEAALDQLAAILVDAVAHGASVNFLAGFTHGEAARFWRGQLPGLAAGERVLIVAADGSRLVGTVIVSYAPQPNAPHRAEIGKMLVHSAYRRRGLGAQLLAAAETAARGAGRSLLILDTQSGSDGERLYRRCGWTRAGEIPDHSLTPDGRLAPTTIFYKKV